MENHSVLCVFQLVHGRSLPDEVISGPQYLTALPLPESPQWSHRPAPNTNDQMYSTL